MNDRLWLVDELPYSSVGRLAACLNERLFDGVEEVVGSRSVLGVYGSPGAGWEQWILEQDVDKFAGRSHEIPVCYEMGEDMSAVAAELGLSRDEVIGHHVSAEYTCFAVGFQPGFAYLGPLDPMISGLPRRGTPRVRVPAGSVGMCLDQTGIYPAISPGGWHLIGRCPLILVDVEDQYFPIATGDSIRFFRIDESEFARREGERL